MPNFRFYQFCDNGTRHINQTKHMTKYTGLYTNKSTMVILCR